MNNFPDDKLIGIDIGGTKTAVVLGNRKPEVFSRHEFPTEPSRGPEHALKKMEKLVAQLLSEAGKNSVKAVGISCGGPLDSRRRLILSPPNLPGWNAVPIGERLEKQFGLPVFLQNDANAGALAEWLWGAGRGTQNMIFLTFGTGLGAGLILNGRLYSGSSDMAGEAGHIRLASEGPEGYGKTGSFEGFCSGGGIARLAVSVLERYREEGRSSILNTHKVLSARDVCLAAEKEDPAALEILALSGEKLGEGLSILIDLLNPEVIVIGSIFTRCGSYLLPAAEEAVKREALKRSASVCRICPAALGEKIGDLASLVTAGLMYNGEE